MKEFREEDYPKKTPWEIIKVILQVIIIAIASICLIVWAANDQAKENNKFQYHSRSK